MEYPPAAIVPFTQVVLVVSPIVKAGFPKAHAHKDPAHTFVWESLEPVWCCKGNNQTDEATYRKYKAESSYETFSPLQRHVKFTCTGRLAWFFFAD